MSQEAVTRDLLDRYARLEAIVRDLKIKQANYRADTKPKLGGGASVGAGFAIGNPANSTAANKTCPAYVPWNHTQFNTGGFLVEGVDKTTIKVPSAGFYSFSFSATFFCYTPNFISAVAYLYDPTVSNPYVFGGLGMDWVWEDSTYINPNGTPNMGGTPIQLNGGWECGAGTTLQIQVAYSDSVTPGTIEPLLYDPRYSPPHLSVWKP